MKQKKRIKKLRSALKKIGRTVRFNGDADFKIKKIVNKALMK